MMSSSMLLTCSEDICIWDLSNYSLLYKLNWPTSTAFTTSTWNSDSQFICVPADEKKLVFCQIIENDILKTQENVGVNVSAICCSRTGSQLVGVGSKTGEVLSCECKNSTVVKKIGAGVSGVTCLDFNRNNSRIAVGCMNGNINIYNTTSGVCTSPLKQEASKTVRGLQYHNTSNDLLASCCDSGRVMLWDVNRGCLFLACPDRHQAPAMDVKFSPIGNSILASVGFDKRTLVHDMRQKKSVTTIRSEVPLRTLEFSPDGIVVVVGGSKGVVRTYDLRSSKELACLNIHTSKPVHKVAINCIRNVKNRKVKLEGRKVLGSTSNGRENQMRNPSPLISPGAVFGMASQSPESDVFSDCSESYEKALKTVIGRSGFDGRQNVISDVSTPNPPSKDLSAGIAFSPLTSQDEVSDNKENLQVPVLINSDSVSEEAQLGETRSEGEGQVEVKERSEAQVEVTTLPSCTTPATTANTSLKVDAVQSMMEDLRESLHMDMVQMHFSFTKQMVHMQMQVQEFQQQNDFLLEEMQKMRDENRRYKASY